jgi:acetyl esterase/lipase
MYKLFLIAILGLTLFSAANAQDKGLTEPVFNRYGQRLEKSGDGWIVPHEDRIISRFNFDPSSVEGWREPWKYIPNRIQPGDMKKYNFETYQYKEYPDYTCEMDVYLPKDQGNGPFPFVLIIHGGGWTTGHRKTPNMVLISEWFASNGIACMSVSYTLSGQGTFENTKADLNDALQFIGNHSRQWKVDPTSFGFYGFSAGGHLTSYMAMTTPGTKMFISAAGPGDMTRHASGYTQEGGNSQMARYWGITAGDTENLRKASPIFLIPQPGAKIPPALIIQGLIDMTVDPKQSIDFASELMKKGTSSVEFMGLSYAGHTTVNQHYYLFEEQMYQLLFFTKKNLIIK